MEPTSPKAADLRRDARYALHCAVEDDSAGQGEFYVTGSAEKVTGEGRRAEGFEAARAAGYKPEARHVLFEFKLTRILATTYQGGRKRGRWSV